MFVGHIVQCLKVGQLKVTSTNKKCMLAKMYSVSLLKCDFHHQKMYVGNIISSARSSNIHWFQ